MVVEIRMCAVEEGLSFARVEPVAGERFVQLRRQLGVSTFGINLITLEPRQRGRIHRHEHQEEVYVVLEGELTLMVEGKEHKLGRGVAVRVGPELRRQLVNEGDERVVLLALGGATPHEGRDGMAYVDWDATDSAPPQEVPLPEDLPG